ncbi:efflux RND transporter permease subunit, partial [Myxococcota bacterium]|nr:efflux RND transporter permease subunit [Myxococcota bacterium]
MSASEKSLDKNSAGEKTAGEKSYSGPIAWMVHNPVAANLLMVLIVAGGIVGIFSVKQEVFPSFDMDMINISVIYPGASPAEVEQGIVLAVEEAVRGVEGVKRITSSAREGLGSITMELYLDADKDRALADTKSAVDRILTFPKDAERPIVSIPSKKRQVVSVIVAGDQDRRSLHDLAEKVRERLLAQKDITQVDLEGVPPLEVGIEISQENLDAQSLSLDQVALAVRKSSLELPGGGVKTSSGEVLVRISDRKRKGHEFRDVVVKSGAGGNVLLLGDIATITDGYAETDQESRYNGQSAVRVTVFRVGKETPKAVAAATRKVVQDIRPDIPQNIQLVVWNDQSEILSARIQLLAKNGMSGLVLVFIVLALVMNFSLSFWVALGIPISFMGAFMFIPMGDQSINMISLFAFIVTLGMVVDDAIVIGENIHSKREKGIPPVQAAIEGAQELAVPVFFSVFTTMVAFSPLFFVPGIMGKIFYVIPFVVISVLMISLVESFFVLPAHLSHAPADPSKSGKVMQTIHFLQGKVSAWLDKFIQNTYRPTLIFALKNKAIAFTAGIGTFVIAIALLVGGQVPFYFFPDIEADIVTVTARFPYGTPLEKTQAAQIVLEDAAQKTIAGNGGEEILVGIYTRMGEGRGSRMGPVEVGANIMTIEVALVPGDDREITAEGFTAEWSENTPPIPGIKALNFIFSTGPGGGSPVDVQLSHFDTQTLADASENLSETLRSYATLIDVESTWSEGKSQLDFHILPEAKNVGLTADDIARQLRASFYGSEAIR